MAGTIRRVGSLLFPIIIGSIQEIWGHMTPFVHGSFTCSTRSEFVWRVLKRVFIGVLTPQFLAVLSKSQEKVVEL